MSKMDNLRAMREARYEQAAARAAKPATAKPAAAKPQAVRHESPAERPAPAPPSDLTEPVATPCGHRNMSGRTCTREAGHAERSHRYS